MNSVNLALHAMATRFEVVLHGGDPLHLRAAGEEALAEIASLEDRLSLYKSSSEIAHINSRAGLEPVRVTPEVFQLLKCAQTLHEQTQGTFDPTVGPLVRCWGFMGGHGHPPSGPELESALARVGMQHVELRDADCTVRFRKAGMMIDLGAIGKGYAIERAAELLRDAEIESALIHGGTSTVCAIGHPPDQDCWQVALEIPSLRAGEPAQHLGHVSLRDESLSVSAIWGRHFQEGDRIRGHVLDPRTGLPVECAWMCALVLPSATATDALSTGMLTLGPEAMERLENFYPGFRCLMVWPEGAQMRTKTRGIVLTNQ